MPPDMVDGGECHRELLTVAPTVVCVGQQGVCLSSSGKSTADSSVSDSERALILKAARNPEVVEKPASQPKPKLLMANDVAEMLNVSMRTVWRLAAQRRLSIPEDSAADAPDSGWRMSSGCVQLTAARNMDELLDRPETPSDDKTYRTA
ncbi:MAG: helix-turn-helix domain-containing protein [Kiritimatiellae bacterium]|nr:helix-turn-helix domain-containing protein [Kiritimatiellia bacterium]